MRPAVGAIALLLASTRGEAAPKPRAPAASAEHAYADARLAFSMPEGTRVKVVSDIVGDYAVELAPKPGTPLERVPFRLLTSQDRVDEDDVERTASGWRTARLRNRASWGVRKRAEQRAEWTHLGGRRFVRLVDQMGSMLGAARQLMVCGAIRGHLVCGVVSAPEANAEAAEAFLDRVLATVDLPAAR